MRDVKSPIATLNRLEKTEAVIAAPFSLFFGALLGLLIALAGRLYLGGHTVLAAIVAGLVGVALFVIFVRSVLDAGTDRIYANMAAEDAKALGEPPMTPEERKRGEVHWVLRYAFRIGIAAGIILGVFVDPLTVLGLIGGSA